MVLRVRIDQISLLLLDEHNSAIQTRGMSFGNEIQIIIRFPVGVYILPIFDCGKKLFFSYSEN